MPTYGGTTIDAASDPTTVALGYQRLSISYVGTDARIFTWLYDGTQNVSTWESQSTLPSTAGGLAAGSW
ncbi:MAG: hypothetical protein ACLQVI_42170 [Polyangiaceae bacterium]